MPRYYYENTAASVLIFDRKFSNVTPIAETRDNYWATSIVNALNSADAAT